jgi:hypothetical protein
MKKIIYLSLLLIIAVSCKKYSQDSSYSTYTAEGRLTKGSGWLCTMYKDEFGNEIKTPNGNYYLKFDLTENQVIGEIIDGKLSIKYFDNTYNIIDPNISKITEKIVAWNFTKNKSKLEIDNIGVFSIEKLMVDKMILKTTKGELYYFDKKPFDEQSIDKTFTGVPFLNVITGNILSYADYYNNCENLSLFTSKNYTLRQCSSPFTKNVVNMVKYSSNSTNSFGFLNSNNLSGVVEDFQIEFSFNNTNGNHLSFNIYDLKKNLPTQMFNYSSWMYLNPYGKNDYLSINGEYYQPECLIEKDSVFQNKEDYYTWKTLIFRNIPKGNISIKINSGSSRDCYGPYDGTQGYTNSDFLIDEIRTLK